MDQPRIEAVLYERMEGDRVRCALCHHRCVIDPGQTGICGVRRNDGGTLHSLVYGLAASAGIDPIEKKPIFHCLPGHDSFSFASVGCNFQCRFCQNHTISQVDNCGIAGQEAPPEQLVAAAVNRGCRSISCTYTEPTVYFEYAAEVCRRAREAGLHTVFVTNGFMTEEALDVLDGSLTCANVDLKAWSDRTYRTVIGARLQPVLDTLERMKGRGIWVEVTTWSSPASTTATGNCRASPRSSPAPSAPRLRGTSAATTRTTATAPPPPPRPPLFTGQWRSALPPVCATSTAETFPARTARARSAGNAPRCSSGGRGSPCGRTGLRRIRPVRSAGRRSAGSGWGGNRLGQLVRG